MHAYHLYNGRTTSRRTVQYSTVRESIFCFDDFPHEVTSHVHSMSSCTQTVITISLASCPLLFQRPVHSHVHPRPVPPPVPSSVVADNGKFVACFMLICICCFIWMWPS